MRLTVVPGVVTNQFPAIAMVRRELLTSLRSRRSIWMLLGFIGLSILVVLNFWPESDQNLAWVGIRSRELVQFLALAVFAGCVLFVPAYASGSIVSERERSTYDFLRMSMISPWGIVFAKLFNAVGMFLLILVSMVPVMSAAFFLVGVDYTVYIKVSIVIATTILSCASIGIMCSSIFQRSITTVVGSYIGVVVLMIGPLLLAYMFAAVVMAFSYTRSVNSVVEAIGVYTSPFMTLVIALEMQGPGWGTTQFYAGLLFQFTVIVLCLLITWWNVRRPPKPPKFSQEKLIDDVKVLRERKTGFPFYILDPLKRKKPIEDGRNPMMVREIRWGLFNRATILIRVFYVAIVIYFIAGATASHDARSFSGMREWFMIQTVLTIMAAPGLIANSMTKEYELGNLDMLRMTLLRPKDIILGKYFAGIAAVSPLLIAAVLSCIPVLVMGFKDYNVLLVGYANLVICTVLSISIGLLSSMVTKQTTVSIMISYVISIMLFFGGTATMEWLDSPRNPEIFSPIFVLFDVFVRGTGRDIGIEYHIWMLTSGVTLFVSFAMVSASVFIFLRFKMQDR